MLAKQIMLVNVKFFKKIFLVFLILLSTNLFADEKNQIINQLNNLNSLEFTFDQLVWHARDTLNNVRDIQDFSRFLEKDTRPLPSQA